MQYVVKRQYEDFVIQAYETNGHLEVFAVSDMAKPTTASVTVSLVHLGGNVCPAAGAAGASNTGPTAWAAKSQLITVPPSSAALVLNISVADMLALAPDCTPSTCYASVTAEAQAVGAAAKRVGDGGGRLSSAADAFLVEFKSLELQAPAIKLSGYTQVRLRPS
jgi:hypothetical protein